MPIVNYKIGDAIKIRDPSTACECGKHTTIITEIIGRQNNFISLPSGRVLTHPDLNMFIQQIDILDEIYEYQLIHYIGSSSIDFRYVASVSFNVDSFINKINDRYADVDFFSSGKSFLLLDNGKKPVIHTASELPSPRRTYDKYIPYLEISDSQSRNDKADVLKLDWNESNSDFPSELKKEVLGELLALPFNRYPDLQVSD